MVDTTGFGGAVSPVSVTTAGGSGDDITFDIGTFTVAGDNDTSNNSFIIRFQVRVLDIAGNVGVNPPGQTSLPNSSTLADRGGPLVPSNTVPATVVEPRIVTTKSVAPTTGVQAGDVLTYTARFTNTGLSTAYDVNARDTLASGTAFTALIDCVDMDFVPVAAMAQDNGATVDFDSGPAPGDWDIPPGGFIECRYTVTAQSGLYIAGSHTNTIDADWSSLNGSDSGERTYDDTASDAVDGTQDTAAATFTTGAPAFGKSDGGVTEAVVGDLITYTLTITSPQGTIRGLNVTDTLPAGLIYSSGSYVVSGIGAPSFSASTPNDGSAPVTLAWNFGDAAVSSSPAKIVFTAVVANVPGNQGGVTLTNDAALTYNDAANTPQTPLSGSDPSSIVEPSLEIAKTVSATSANVGDRVRCSL